MPTWGSLWEGRCQVRLRWGGPSVVVSPEVIVRGWQATGLTLVLDYTADGLLTLSKDLPGLGLPMGSKLVTLSEQPDLNGDVCGAGLPANEYAFNPCGGTATVGAPAWGFCNVGNVNALGMGIHASQLQSKRLQQAMAMRASVGPTPVPGHAKKSKEEVAAQVERVKKRRRESAQRSRQRKNEYMKNLEEENRALKYELGKLRQWMNRLQKDAALSPSPSVSLSHGSNHTNL
eukprot:jgi/Botrbrau1/7990/Bobra.384_2s0018.1